VAGKRNYQFFSCLEWNNTLWDSHFILQLFKQQNAGVVKYETTKLNPEKAVWSEMFLEWVFSLGYLCSTGQWWTMLYSAWEIIHRGSFALGVCLFFQKFEVAAHPLTAHFLRDTKQETKPGKKKFMISHLPVNPFYV
jgi:hypothetical protein